MVRSRIRPARKFASIRGRYRQVGGLKFWRNSIRNVFVARRHSPQNPHTWITSFHFHGAVERRLRIFNRSAAPAI